MEVGRPATWVTILGRTYIFLTIYNDIGMLYNPRLVIQHRETEALFC